MLKQNAPGRRGGEYEAPWLTWKIEEHSRPLMSLGFQS